MEKQMQAAKDNLNTDYIWGCYKNVYAMKWNELKSGMKDKFNKDKLNNLAKEIVDEYIQSLHNLCSGSECKASYMNEINKQPFERFSELEDSLAEPEITDMVEYYGREEFFYKVKDVLDLFERTYKDYEEDELLRLSKWLKYIYKYKDFDNDYNNIINFSYAIISPKNKGMLGFEYFMSKIDNMQDENIFNRLAPIAMQVLNAFGQRKKHMLEKMFEEFMMSDSNNLEYITSFQSIALDICLQAKELLTEDKDLEIYYRVICDINILLNKLVKRLLCEKYENTEDKEIKEIINNIKKNGIVVVYNYDFVHKSYDIEVFRDEEAEMLYIYYKGRKMYFPKKYINIDDVKKYYDFLMKEQDTDSPHLYETEGMEVEEHFIVIDAGVAEGNFALDVIDRVDKIYLIECDPDWVEALRHTFKGEDKVIIIDKMLSNKQDDLHIDIDSIMKGENLNYLKMDIEGSELDALDGAKKTLTESVNCKCNICAYHKSGDAEKITTKLTQYGFNTFPGKGYMFFNCDIQSFIDLEFRRGLIKGIKK